MKKLFSTLLTLVFVLSMGTMAFADTDNPGNPIGNQGDADWTEVIFKKTITSENEGAKHPAETFNFTITPVSAMDEQENAIDPIPVFNPDSFTIEVPEGSGSGTKAVELPVFSNIGTYVYKVQEKVSNTAGMTYDVTEYEFTIIVVNDTEKGTLKRLVLRPETGKNEKNEPTYGDKTDIFKNSYDAGKLIVTKKITGNNANFEEKFPVTVTLTPEATGDSFKPIKSKIDVSGDINSVVDYPTVIGYPDATTGVITITFWVTDKSEVTINNIPYEVGYEVKETDTKNYTASYVNEQGTITDDSQTTEITNTKEIEVATGISLDSIPYIMILGLAVLGISGLFLRRRKNADF